MQDSLDSLTKREVKRILTQLGRSSAGPRVDLLARLREVLPHAAYIERKEDEVKLLDESKTAIDLNAFATEIQVVLEQKPAPLPIEERFPGRKIVLGEHQGKDGLRAAFPVQGSSLDKEKQGGGVKRSRERSQYEMTAPLRAAVERCQRTEKSCVIVVLGRCGSGKSTLLQQLWPKAVSQPVPSWDASKAVVSQFQDGEDAARWLMAAGLSSIPSWCKPYHILSTGERYRAEMAKRISLAHVARDPVHSTQEPIVLDNFTSQLDRVTAMACSAAIAKTVRRLKLSCVVASSNEDIVAWMQPDVILSMDNQDPSKVCVLDIKEPDSRGPCPIVHLKHELCRALQEDSSGAWSTEAKMGPTDVVGAPGGPALLSRAVELEKLCCQRFRHNPSEEPTTFAASETSSDETSFQGPVLRSEVKVDSATELCDKLFDRAFDGECVLEVPGLSPLIVNGAFTVGVICGNSGSAKSVVLREYFGNPSTVEWHEGVPVAAHFSSSSTASTLLSVVCLTSEVFGKRSFQELSAGEQDLVDLARLLEYDNVCIDEFTSRLDRELACRLARNVAQFLRQTRGNGGARRFTFVSCHRDVLAWLQPDWVFDTGLRALLPKKSFVLALNDPHEGVQPLVESLRKRGVLGADLSLRVPTLDVTFERCAPWVWQFFRDHHYKTKTLSAHARTFVLRQGSELVGFVATIKQVGKKHTLPQSEGLGGEGVEEPKTTGAWRAHRTVVLPSWQGLGLGSRLSDACAEAHRLGCCTAYLAQTVHPRFGQYRDHSPLWRATKWNHTVQEFKIESWTQRLENTRTKLLLPKYIYAHAYVGPVDAASAVGFGSRVHVHS
mmetsp:Transcript_11499/g.21328  ORF Transcript_11499/g.21328 Transcript_11499/m.21328 type:complete len:834 (+) Transcript_11499:113-2614(+)